MSTQPQPQPQPQPRKKPRLIIIKKEQQEVSTADSTADSTAVVGGRNPRRNPRRNPPRTPPAPPIERSSVAGGRNPPSIACTRFNNKTWQERQQWLATYQTRYEQRYQRPLKCIYGTPREIANTKFAPQQSILVIEMNNDENRIIGIGEIKNQTASEVYRNPSAVVSFPPSAVVSLATAHSTPASGTVLNPDKALLNPDKNDAANRPPSQGGGTPGGTPTPLKYNIFSDRNYSRYIYIGNTYYATREELIRNHTTDAQYINEQLINQLPSPQTPHHHQEPNQPTESVIRYLEQILFKGPKHMKRGSGITRIPDRSDPHRPPQTPQTPTDPPIQTPHPRRET